MVSENLCQPQSSLLKHALTLFVKAKVRQELGLARRHRSHCLSYLLVLLSRGPLLLLFLQGKLVSAMMKKHLVESVIPLLIELKHMLQVGLQVQEAFSRPFQLERTSSAAP